MGDKMITHRGPFKSERDLAMWERKVKKYFKEQSEKTPSIRDDGKNKKLEDFLKEDTDD